LIIPFIRAADEDTEVALATLEGEPRNSLVEYQQPEGLTKLMDFNLPDGGGKGKEGLLQLVQDVLKYSVNTWHQGFLDKLYSSTNAPGVISELVLAVLNTNVCVANAEHLTQLTELQGSCLSSFASPNCY